MAEKLTTIDQLKKLALRTKADSAARISELAEMIAAGLEDAQIGFTVTLPAANWSGRAQTVQHESFLADSSILSAATPTASLSAVTPASERTTL